MGPDRGHVDKIRLELGKKLGGEVKIVTPSCASRSARASRRRPTTSRPKSRRRPSGPCSRATRSELGPRDALRRQRRPRRDPELLRRSTASPAPDGPARTRSTTWRSIASTALARPPRASRSRSSPSAAISRAPRPRRSCAPRTARGHEIANHSLDHRYDLVRLGRAEIARQVERGRASHRARGGRGAGRLPRARVHDHRRGLRRPRASSASRYDSSVFPCPPYWAAKAAAIGAIALRGRDEPVDPRHARRARSRRRALTAWARRTGGAAPACSSSRCR